MNNTIIISHDHGLYALSSQYSINSINSVNIDYKIGDIYYGKVERLLPSINSAFIKLNPTTKYSSTGFIYIKDLKCIKKIRALNNNLKVHPLYQIIVNRQKIITQVVKEMHFEKGPRLTTIIVLNGYYLKLLPFSNIIYVSTKIQNTILRNQLKAVGKLILLDGMGIIFRSNAIGISPEILLRELYLLKQQWFFISKRLLTFNNIVLLYKQDNFISNCIRDYYSYDTKQIFIDNFDIVSQFKFFLNYWKCMELTDISIQKKINIYKNQFDFWNSTNLDIVVNNLFRNIIHLPYGGYLFLETINAMTIIDVNSGNFNSNDNTRDNVLKVNLAAAQEIVYQITIRNIAGIILIDFIDMNIQGDKELLLEYLFNLLQNDSKQSSIIQYSQLGIVEITRKRASKSFHTSGKADYDNIVKLSDNNLLLKKVILFDHIQYSALYD